MSHFIGGHWNKYFILSLVIIESFVFIKNSLTSKHRLEVGDLRYLYMYVPSVTLYRIYINRYRSYVTDYKC